MFEEKDNLQGKWQRKNNMIRDYIRQGLQEEQLKRNYNNKDRLSCIIKN